MSYSPTPGSNISQIFDCVSNKKQTVDQLINKMQSKYPHVPINSVHTHLKFLIKKKLVILKDYYYFLNSDEQDSDNKPQSKSLSILFYCKARIGKKVNSREMIDSICDRNIKDTTPATVLKQLYLMGVVRRIEGSRPLDYLVLPEIKTIDRISYSANLPAIKQTNKPAIKQTKKVEPKILPNDNISDLSIGQILTEHLALKDENRRLRDALQRIAHELYQVGEVET